MRHLALDGPNNGDYLTAAEAEAAGYELTEWTEGEQAYLHVASVAEFDDEGVPPEIADEIEAGLR